MRAEQEKGCSEGGAQGAHGWPLGEGQGKDSRVKLDKRTHQSVLAGPWGTAGSRPWVAAQSPSGLLQSPLHLGLLRQGTSSLTQGEPGRPGREQGQHAAKQHLASPTAQSNGTHSLGSGKRIGKRKEWGKRKEHPPNPTPLCLTDKTSPWTHLLLLIEHRLSARHWGHNSE